MAVRIFSGVYCFFAVVAALVASLTLSLVGCTPQEASSGEALAQAAGGRGAMARFHSAVGDLERGRTGRVTIVQIGDSHTAADHLSGRLRDRMQGRFGNAGRGMLPPGTPFAYWRPYQVSVEQTGRWTVNSSIRGNSGSAAYGLSGFTIVGSARTDMMSLAARDQAEFDTVTVSTWTRPGGGKLAVEVDGQRIGVIDTAGSPVRLEKATFSGEPGRRTLALRPEGNGPVEIADWAVYRKERGVVLTSHGFPGATIDILGTWNWQVTQKQLADLAPALILVAFGTNEGFAPVDALGAYEAQFESYIRLLQQAAPRASIMVMGPPDADRMPDYCGGRGDQRDRRPCQALSASEASSYAELLRGRSATLCRWHPPAGIARVREAQRRVAQRLGVGFWDWSEVQGGACGADRWAKLEPPLEHKDRVHMREDGYAMSADRLYERLMDGYRRP